MIYFLKNPGFITSKADLEKPLQFATSGTRFIDEGKFYDQIDGVAMGSPMVPVFANFFYGVS